MAKSEERWTAEKLPDLSGKTILVTGANSGLGLEATRMLAGRGATVVMGCRNREKAEVARADVAQSEGDVQTEILPMDLSRLASVREAAAEFLERHDRLDVLINNAGVMFLHETRTEDGFELQMGTNHFAHFALTGLLLERLLSTPGARVVTVSSLGHRPGSIDFDNLNFENGYNRFFAYFRSKLANLLFTFELQRRLERSDFDAIAVAAHPGSSSTNLGALDRRADWLWWLEPILRPIITSFAQTAAMGALPIVRAAADSDVRGGDYYGPDGFGEQTGYPVKVGSSRRARDEETARRLWEVSEELTGVSFDALPR